MQCNSSAIECSANATQRGAILYMQQEQDSTSNTNTSAYVSFSYDESAIQGYKCMNVL